MESSPSAPDELIARLEGWSLEKRPRFQGGGVGELEES